MPTPGGGGGGGGGGSKRKKKNKKGKGNTKRREGKKLKSEKPSYRFTDRARLRVLGGRGGKGSLSAEMVGRGPKKRPDGGNGGNGGHVVLVADPQKQMLRFSHPHVTGMDGTHGSSQNKHGRNGMNRIVRVPCGVVVRRVLGHDEHWDEEAFRAYRLENENNEEGDDENETTWRRYTSGIDEDDDFTGVQYYEDDDDDDGIPHFSVDIPGYDMSKLGNMDFDSDDEDDFDDDFDGNVHAESAQKERKKIVLADLDEPGSWVVVARGGRGGGGNGLFASDNGPLPDPMYLTKRASGKPGEGAFLELELKMIADVGLVGFPNAGKSSILAAMSRAGPEIAPYPFTTLHPMMGVIEYRDGFRLRAADVPGLVAGASEGRGRGHDFLRHLERTKGLMYVLDAAGTDGRDPVEDLQALVHELDAYGDGELATRQSIVVANKVDLLEEDQRVDILSELGLVAQEGGLNTDGTVVGISAGVTGEGLSELSRKLRDLVVAVNAVSSDDDDHDDDHDGSNGNDDDNEFY